MLTSNSAKSTKARLTHTKPINWQILWSLSSIFETSRQTDWQMNLPQKRKSKVSKLSNAMFFISKKLIAFRCSELSCRTKRNTTLRKYQNACICFPGETDPIQLHFVPQSDMRKTFLWKVTLGSGLSFLFSKLINLANFKTFSQSLTFSIKLPLTTLSLLNRSLSRKKQSKAQPSRVRSKERTSRPTS